MSSCMVVSLNLSVLRSCISSNLSVLRSCNPSCLSSSTSLVLPQRTVLHHLNFSSSRLYSHLNYASTLNSLIYVSSQPHLVYFHCTHSNTCIMSTFCTFHQNSYVGAQMRTILHIKNHHTLPLVTWNDRYVQWYPIKKGPWRGSKGPFKKYCFLWTNHWSDSGFCYIEYQIEKKCL